MKEIIKAGKIPETMKGGGGWQEQMTEEERKREEERGRERKREEERLKVKLKEDGSIICQREDCPNLNKPLKKHEYYGAVESLQCPNCPTMVDVDEEEKIKIKKTK